LLQTFFNSTLFLICLIIKDGGWLEPSTPTKTNNLSVIAQVSLNLPTIGLMNEQLEK